MRNPLANPKSHLRRTLPPSLRAPQPCLRFRLVPRSIALSSKARLPAWRNQKRRSGSRWRRDIAPPQERLRYSQSLTLHLCLTFLTPYISIIPDLDLSSDIIWYPRFPIISLRSATHLSLSLEPSIDATSHFISISLHLYLSIRLTFNPFHLRQSHFSDPRSSISLSLHLYCSVYPSQTFNPAHAIPCSMSLYPFFLLAAPVYFC